MAENGLGLYAADPDKQGLQSLPDAQNLADGLVEQIAAAPEDYALHTRLLEDFRDELSALAARSAEEKLGTSLAWPKDLVWRIGREMPPFSREGLYQKRSSLWGMAGMLLLGWFLGGFLSSVLEFIGLGGEILRVLAIWGMFWFSECLAANPKLRHGLLALLGLGALGRFASGIMSGILRLGSWGAWKEAIFGSSRLPNPFKFAWLLLGALFIFIFLSKKVTALDISAFRHALRRQGADRFNFLLAIYEEIGSLVLRLEELESKAKESGVRSCADGALAEGIIGSLGTLAPDTRRFFLRRLADAGYTLPCEEDADTLIWNTERHRALYECIGLVQDGDACRILKPAMTGKDGVFKGHVQRIGASQ